MSRKPHPQRVTLAQVAEASSVSVTTASLILSGRPEYLAQFQPQTIQRVRSSAEQLGYRANLFASSLLAERALFYALVIRGHTPDQEAWRYGAYDSELMCGTAEGAADVYPIVALAGPDPDKAKVQGIERIMAGGVFGTIARTPAPMLEACLRQRMERGHPIAVVFPARLEDWPHNIVDVDNLAVGDWAGRLLAARGSKRWLLLTDEQYHAGQMLREQGCEAAARLAGVEWETICLPKDLDAAELESWLADRIRCYRADGVFGMTLRAASATLGACRTCELEPGRDIGLVGCDCAFWSHAPDPQITSVDVSWYQAGAAAIRQLVRMAELGEGRFDPILLPPRIVEGQTCPVPPGLLA
jgi:LacI family transcriptional regulator